MPADVIEGAHFPGGIAGNDDAFSGQLAEEVVARSGNGAIASGADPVSNSQLSAEFPADPAGTYAVCCSGLPKRERISRSAISQSWFSSPFPLPARCR